MSEFFKELLMESRLAINKDGKKRAKTVEEAALAIIDSGKFTALFAEHPLAEAEICDWIGSQAANIGNNLGTITFATVVTVPGFPPRKEAVDQLRHLERALELRRVHLGPDHPKTLATMHKVGCVLLSQSHNLKALVLRDELVARSNAALGPSHPDTLAYKRSLASAYEQAGRLEEAVLLLADSYSLAREKWGKDSYESLNCSNPLAAAYEKSGRIKEALRQWEESLRCKRNLAVVSKDPGSVEYELRQVARLHVKMQDYTQAEPVLRECLALRVNDRPDDRETFLTMSLLGVALLEQKKYADAEPLLLAGYEGMKKATDGNNAEQQARKIEELQRLVQLYEAMNKKDKADTWRKKLQEAKDAAKKPAKP